MNVEKLNKLQSQVRIGGKGTARRKKKVVRHTTTTDDKKLQSTLKKLAVNSIPGIEEVNMFKDDGTVIHFTNPKVQASLNSNTFAVTGSAESKSLSDMMPGILNQMRPDNLSYLKSLMGQAQAGADGSAALEELLKNANLGGGGLSELKEEEGENDDDDVPDLVQNFDEAARLPQKGAADEAGKAEAGKTEID